jgi:hypothetical protein
MVYIEKTGKDNFPSRYRCEGKIKPGTPFCKEHFSTHRIVTVKCTGEAHSNPYIDNCGVCMPHWGKYPIAVPNEVPADQVDRFICEGGQVSEYD